MTSLQRAAFIFLAAIGPLSGCAVQEASPVAFTDFDPGTDFSNYQTFAWMRPDPLYNATAQPVTPSLQQNLMRDTAAGLTAKGYRQVSKPADADFVVSFAIGTVNSLQENNYPGRTNPLASSDLDYPESSEIREVTTGAISIEIFEARSGRRTWTGWATTGLTLDVRADAKAVTNEMVTLILAKFPPS